MDLQTRKLNAIEYLIKLQDETVLNEIELTISETKTRNSKILTPFSKKQLIDRAKSANKDYIKGKIKTQEQVELESEKW